jgi:hypothetical protein
MQRNGTAVSDGDASDDSIATMSLAELVRVLNRLYARIGESPITTSAARASTSDELRMVIRAVRRRLAGKPESEPPPTTQATERDLPKTRGERPRMFVMIVTPDAALVSQSRALLRAHGVPVVAVATGGDLATLARQTMPTHIVIDGRHASAVSLGSALGVRSRDVSILQGSDPDAVLAAVSAIVTAAPRPR